MSWHYFFLHYRRCAVNSSNCFRFLASEIILQRWSIYEANKKDKFHFWIRTVHRQIQKLDYYYQISSRTLLRFPKTIEIFLIASLFTLLSMKYRLLYDFLFSYFMPSRLTHMKLWKKLDQVLYSMLKYGNNDL